MPYRRLRSFENKSHAVRRYNRVACDIFLFLSFASVALVSLVLAVEVPDCHKFLVSFNLRRASTGEDKSLILVLLRRVARTNRGSSFYFLTSCARNYRMIEIMTVT